MRHWVMESVMGWQMIGGYRDRREAGERLVAVLRGEAGLDLGEGAIGNGLVVLGAPRGGVAVAVPIAEALGAPIDVVLARKLPAPGNPELGFGAIGEGGVRVMDRQIIALLGLTEPEVEKIAERVTAEIEERSRLYRSTRAAIPLEGRCALVVDDGVATGVTLAAAVGSARKRGAAMVIAVAPVSSTEAEERIAETADRFICPMVDPSFMGVGAYYRDFPQLTDTEVISLLKSVDGGIADRRSGGKISREG